MEISSEVFLFIVIPQWRLPETLGRALHSGEETKMKELTDKFLKDQNWKQWALFKDPVSSSTVTEGHSCISPHPQALYCISDSLSDFYI